MIVFRILHLIMTSSKLVVRIYRRCVCLVALQFVRELVTKIKIHVNTSKYQHVYLICANSTFVVFGFEI